MLKQVILAALALVLAAGCSQGVRYSPGELEMFAREVGEHIRKREISLGMSQAAVRYSWGAPKAVKSVPEENREIWVYSTMRVYVTKLTFVDGRLKDSSSGLSFNNPLALSDKERSREPASSTEAPEPYSDAVKLEE